ncbi:THOC5 [Cervus elaphus hippelaphus]|uniref:THOC5 n=1 Tax=Cervus elaphus hippelaphus TaxID=46360 RepID=A0A212DAB0_CEREH|nr:THOC5 [Cervus elaphus hippelaphus]
MESEVNVCYKELCGPRPGHQLLTNQLQRLCVLLDVYLETESHDDSVEGPKEFPQEKMCLRLFRCLACPHLLTQPASAPEAVPRPPASIWPFRLAWLPVLADDNQLQPHCGCMGSQQDEAV